MGRDTPAAPQSLDAVRARIDAVDADLLRLLGERAALAKAVVAAKREAGDGGKFGLRPGREAQIVRKLLANKDPAASNALVVRVWREIMADSLSQQGPFHLTVWGGKLESRAVELARLRFGAAPALKVAAKPEDALAAAKTPGGVAILALTPDSSWWGRLLAEPTLRVFATLPCLSAWGPTAAVAVAQVAVEPTGADQTLWVTDAPDIGKTIEALSRDGVAGGPLAQHGGLTLYALAGYYQHHDARLARAPGRLHGVIGAAPEPFDL
ncbi:chorismate mutase [Caulobacter mirabilis]|uniref:chorismate mutase n=1 Tax=Caulobacter mirabilis TaxID=69666 RepID=A0A2D2B032_9CAUL|nr:chorismate mutase [Caulobacter mirabilis]ATQ43604.1 chorismate mutase [Caulobacter mirabilis]